MKCLICGKVIRGKNFVTFSTGEKVCKSHVEQFEKQNSFEVVENFQALKERIVLESLQEIIKYIREQIGLTPECLQNCEIGDLVQDIYNQVFNEERIEKYDEIILMYKQKYDIYNKINFEHIKFNSEYFKEKYVQFVNNESVKMLQNETFLIMHKNILDLIPKDENYAKNLFATVDSQFAGMPIELTLMPFTLMCRTIWMFHTKATAEQIVYAVLRWIDNKYLKQMFAQRQDCFNMVVEQLNVVGPQQTIDQTFEDLLKKLKID